MANQTWTVSYEVDQFGTVWLLFAIQDQVVPAIFLISAKSENVFSD